MKVFDFERTASIAIIAMLVVTLVAAIGCDEGMNMTKTVVGEPSETPEPVMTGKVKQPTESKEDPGESESKEDPDPPQESEEPEPEEEPEEFEDPEPEPEPVEVVEVGYYADQDLTISLTEPPYFGTLIYEPGVAIYAKVVFSGPVKVTVGGPGVAQPRIYYEFSGRYEDALAYSNTYRMLPRETPVSRLESGEAKQLEGADNTLICKYVLVTNEGRRSGSFRSYPSGGRIFDNSVRADSFGRNFDITDPPQIMDLLSGSDAAHPPPHTNPEDFLGRVCVPFSLSTGSATGSHPVSGVTVTIIAGPRSGEQTVTDPGGYYLFRDIRLEDLIDYGLHLKVEKEHFEPKEVIAYRANIPTALRNPKTGLDARITVYRAGWLGKPGVVVIGQRWPDEIRFVFEEMFLPDDLLLYVDDGSTLAVADGTYGDGIIKIRDAGPQSDISNATILHELTHAHQHALAMREFGEYESTWDWPRTAEGKAYAAAQAADWQEFGKTGSDKSNESLHHGIPLLFENAAQVGNAYWGIEYLGGISHLQTQAPNRLRWAQEWLHKQY